jgi:C-terminal processing protease CtpA/Prc
MLDKSKSALFLIFCFFVLVVTPPTQANATEAAKALPAAPPVAAQLIPAQATQDVRILKRALTELHPALTKYRTQTEIDAAFAQFESRGNAARTPTEMYLAATELAAAIRCGHTWTNVFNQQGAVKAALRETANKLPFTMKLVEGRWLVLASTDAAIAKGDEVLAVNGVRATEMVSMMMPYLRADGSSDGKRLVQLNHDRADFSQMDILWPLLRGPQDGFYTVTRLRDGGDGKVAEVRVAATTLAARTEALAKQGVKPIDTSWKFRIEGNVATLTLPTFSFWNSKFDWKAFLENTFAELNAKSVPTLVIDIRANEGGDGAIGAALLSYLIAEPLKIRSVQAVTSYERVPYILAKHLDTWDYGFFDRTGKVEKLTMGTAAGKYIVTARANAQREIAPVEASRRYKGKVYMLVGPENSSATFQLALFAKQSGVITLVGQTTGGNQRGLNGGELTWVVLPNSGVSVDIPLLATTYEADTPDASVTPDVIITRRFGVQRAGRDEEMEAVTREIARLR